MPKPVPAVDSSSDSLDESEESSSSVASAPDPTPDLSDSGGSSSDDSDSSSTAPPKKKPSTTLEGKTTRKTKPPTPSGTSNSDDEEGDSDDDISSMPIEEELQKEDKRLDERFTTAQLEYLLGIKERYRFASARERSTMSEKQTNYLFMNTALVKRTQKALYEAYSGQSASEPELGCDNPDLVDEETAVEAPGKTVTPFHFFQKALSAEWNALSEEERETYEDLALNWRTDGPSDETRKLLAEKEACRVIRYLAHDLYRQMGVRIFVLANYEDSNDDIVAVSLDFNNELGSHGQSYKVGAKSYLERIGLLENYAAFVKRTSPPKGEEIDRKATARDIHFELNSVGDPMVPDPDQPKKPLKDYVWYPTVVRKYMHYDWGETIASLKALRVPADCNLQPEHKVNLFGNRTVLPGSIYVPMWSCISIRNISLTAPPLKDPGLFGLQNCKSLVRHWWKRQSMGLVAFRFRGYFDGHTFVSRVPDPLTDESDGFAPSDSEVKPPTVRIDPGTKVPKVKPTSSQKTPRPTLNPSIQPDPGRKKEPTTSKSSKTTKSSKAVPSPKQPSDARNVSSSEQLPDVEEFPEGRMPKPRKKGKGPKVGKTKKSPTLDPATPGALPTEKSEEGRSLTPSEDSLVQAAVALTLRTPEREETGTDAPVLGATETGSQKKTKKKEKAREEVATVGESEDNRMPVREDPKRGKGKRRGRLGKESVGDGDDMPSSSEQKEAAQRSAEVFKSTQSEASTIPRQKDKKNNRKNSGEEGTGYGDVKRDIEATGDVGVTHGASDKGTQGVLASRTRRKVPAEERDTLDISPAWQVATPSRARKRSVKFGETS
ncbi:hypothetical protein NMY22_g8208 [Coprinellus aureogranulatus]|nr:hypothetical protein NMY22_g8208 [Coprinellus aureogranulatus]